jgi:hypothetical protein
MMKLKPGILRVEFFAVLALLAALALHYGCSVAQRERAADDVGYVFGGASASTQPSSHQVLLDAARGAATITKTVYPPAGLVFAGVAAIAALFGSAGHTVGKRTTFKQMGSVIGEFADDVVAFKEPHVPWSSATREVLLQLGRDDVAHPDSYPIDFNWTTGLPNMPDAAHIQASPATPTPSPGKA